MKELNGDAIRGHLESLVLASLSRGESHGFEILRRLEEETGGVLRLKEGTLYPALYRLEEEGCVKADWEGDSGGRRGPRRRIYQITAKGRKKLTEGRESWRLLVATLGPLLEERK